MNSITFSAEAVLMELIVCGKLQLSDIEPCDRISLNGVYSAERRRNRNLNTSVEKIAYIKMLQIIANDLAQADETQTKDRLLDIFFRYRQYGAEHGLVFEDFP